MSHSGYLSSDYGNSFSDFGTVITLPNSRIQLLKRHVTADYFDLAGIYPYTMCNNWSSLYLDAEFLRTSGAVSLVLVTDPFEKEKAHRAISNWHLCKPFKSHFVVNLSIDWRAKISANMRKRTRKALKAHDVFIAENPLDFANEFWELYQTIITRHHIVGITQFSKAIIYRQLNIEGAVLVVAKHDKKIVGMFLGFDNGVVGYAHLLCLQELAYKLSTTNVLYHTMLQELERRGCKYFNLGGVAGFVNDPTNGLNRFKSRWTKEVRTSMLCGEIYNFTRYKELTELAGSTANGFFPAYRSPGSFFE